MAEHSPPQPDREFFESVNECLDLTRKQAEQSGPQRASIASLFAAARFSAYLFMGTVPKDEIGNNRTPYLDHTTALFRRMLNEQLDALGREHNVDVGVSELAQAAYDTAADVVAPTSAAAYVAAAGAMPPSNDPQAQ